MNLMRTEHKVVDEASENSFNLQLISDLERLKNIDNVKNTIFNEDKTKEEMSNSSSQLQTGQNSKDFIIKSRTVSRSPQKSQKGAPSELQ